MGGIILMQLLIWLILIIFIMILGADASCRIILDKAIPNYRSKFKSSIPGYNIYSYLKWKKEFKQ